MSTDITREKAFATSVSRDIIRVCEKIGILLSEFAAISLAQCNLSVRN